MTTRTEWIIGIVGGLTLVFGLVFFIPYEFAGPAIILLVCAAVFWEASICF